MIHDGREQCMRGLARLPREVSVQWSFDFDHSSLEETIMPQSVREDFAGLAYEIDSIMRTAQRVARLDHSFELCLRTRRMEG